MTQLDDRIYTIGRKLTSHTSICKIVTVLAFGGLVGSTDGLRSNPAQATIGLAFGLVAATGLIALAIDGSRSRN